MILSGGSWGFNLVMCICWGLARCPLGIINGPIAVFKVEAPALLNLSVWKLFLYQWVVGHIPVHSPWLYTVLQALYFIFASVFPTSHFSSRPR